MFELQLNKSKLNINAPTYMPKSVKIPNLNQESFFIKEKSPFNFLQFPIKEGINSPATANELPSKNIILQNLKNIHFNNQENSQSKDQETFEISSTISFNYLLGFMIDNSVFQRICSSSLFIDKYPMKLRPVLNDFNQVGKPNLHMLLIQKASTSLNMNSNFFPSFKEKECFLCLQSMIKGKKFGLLSNFAYLNFLVNCDHVFCIECIKLWRKDLLIAKKNEMYRQCPICKTESFHVIPSEVFITEKIVKMNLAQEKKKKLSKIPCKYKTSNKDECPFGNSCFYNHTIN